MKKYRIVKNIEAWLGCETPNETNVIIDEAELNDLSQAWEKPVGELMDDLEEIEEHAEKIITEKTKIAIDGTGNTYDADELVYHTGDVVEYDSEKYILVRQASPDNILGEDIPCYSAPAVKIGDEVDEDGWCKRYYIVWKVVDGFDGEDGSLACDWDEPYDVQEVQATEYNINSGQFY